MIDNADRIDSIVGSNILRVRKEKGISQQQLASALVPPMTFQQISKYERGDNKVHAERLVALATALGCSVSEFFVGVSGLLPNSQKISVDDGLAPYTSLSKPLQDGVKTLIEAMVKEFVMKGKMP